MEKNVKRFYKRPKRYLKKKKKYTDGINTSWRSFVLINIAGLQNVFLFPSSITWLNVELFMYLYVYLYFAARLSNEKMRSRDVRLFNAVSAEFYNLAVSKPEKYAMYARIMTYENVNIAETRIIISNIIDTNAIFHKRLFSTDARYYDI